MIRIDDMPDGALRITANTDGNDLTDFMKKHTKKLNHSLPCYVNPPLRQSGYRHPDGWETLIWENGVLQSICHIWNKDAKRIIRRYSMDNVTLCCDILVPKSSRYCMFSRITGISDKED